MSSILPLLVICIALCTYAGLVLADDDVQPITVPVKASGTRLVSLHVAQDDMARLARLSFTRRLACALQLAKDNALDDDNAVEKCRV